MTSMAMQRNRQVRVKIRRNQRVYHTRNPDELARQLSFLEQNLYVDVGDLGGEYRGVDGVDVVGQLIRDSHDIVTDAISGTVSGYNPTGFGTCDILVLTGSSSPVLAGMAAPGKSGTRTKLIINAGSTTITIPHESGSEATPTNRFVGPNQQDVELFRGESMLVKYVDNRTNSARWQTIGRHDWQSVIDALDTVNDHGELDGLSDDDHPQYLLTNGSRALGGNWSLGGHDLSNANAISFNSAGYIDGPQLIQMESTPFSNIDMGTGYINNAGSVTVTSGGTVNFNNGFGTNVDTLTMNGAGSAINSLATLSMVTGGGGTIDMNSGVITDAVQLAFNASLSTFITNPKSISMFPDTASNIDFNNGFADAVDHATFNGVGSYVDGLGRITLIGDSTNLTSPASSTSVTAQGPVLNAPYINVRSQNGARILGSRARATGLSSGSPVTADINLTSVRGIDFTLRPVLVTAKFFSWRASASTYVEQIAVDQFCAMRFSSGADVDVGYMFYEDPDSHTTEYFKAHKTVITGNAAVVEIDISPINTTTFRVTGYVIGAGSDRVGELWVELEAPL